MSALIVHQCDGCGWRSEWPVMKGLSMETNRRYYHKRHGWHIRPKGNVRGEVVTRDICPTCWEAGKR